MARKLFSYNRFLGLDTVTSPSNMSERFLVDLSDAYIDFRGQIIKGPSISKLSGNTEKHYNIRHYGSGDLVRYILNGSNIDIKSNSVTQSTGFNSGTASITPISTVNFDQKQFAFMSGHNPFHFNGSAFTTVSGFGSTNFSSLGSYPKGGFAVNILNRLVVAGIPSRDTEIHVSEQDSFVNWRTNTSSGTTPNQTDGVIIDVKNQFTSRDTIQGLSVLEGDKLVIFGQNETLVFLADTNINLWEIARDFRVPIGIFGRNTAVNVGTDVFFCSRFGVHSLKRASSGLTLETVTFTREIQDLYQSLVDNVPTTGSFTEPHAVWDGEIGQYHVFFPQNTAGTNFTKLTFTYDPSAGRSGHLSFGNTTGHNGTCGSYFARPDTSSGVSALQMGTTSGYGDGQSLTQSNSMSVRTPLLSQGSPDTYKHYKRLIIRAVGTADFVVTIFDSENNQLQQTTVRPENDGFATTTGISGDSTRPIDLPIPHRSKSISVQLSCTATGALKILDFALVVDTK